MVDNSPAHLSNVQGDILLSLPKRHESFLFFQIKGDQVKKFRQQLSNLIPLITTAAKGKKNLQKVVEHKKRHHSNGSQIPIGDNLLTITAINIAFSKAGLDKLGISDSLGDKYFEAGMQNDITELGDKIEDWIPEFKGQQIDGVINVSGDSEETVDESIEHVHGVFSIDTFREIITLRGKVRPKKEKGHEHFGFLDGVSQPAIKSVDTTPNPGQETVEQGVFLLGRELDLGVNDPLNALSTPPKPALEPVTRPAWATDGSFLAFRYLKQKVPEFHEFTKRNALTVPPSTDPAHHNPTGAELLAARLVGRWPSGAPIDITPLRDDPELGSDPLQNDDFSYTTLNPDDQSSQERCPFAAHTRKTNPRGDLAQLGGTHIRRILRRGIQYGPELTYTEKRENRTIENRGLLFACYQSNIFNGFRFIQERWANTENFPIQKPQVPGVDPIIGQAVQDLNHNTLKLTGTNPANPTGQLTTFPWVISQGGEYFFSPSLSALRGKLALPA